MRMILLKLQLYMCWRYVASSVASVYTYTLLNVSISYGPKEAVSVLCICLKTK